MYDLLIIDGRVVDPGNGLQGRFDVAVTAKRVAEVAPDLDRGQARQIVRAEGKWVLPGLVDSHVHISGRPQGHRMLARAGVTTALDTAGQPVAMIDGLQKAGTGLTVGFVYPLVPGETIPGENSSQAELERVLDAALSQGALGVKVLGGHYPLTPEATARVIQVAHEKQCWCAVHAGTTASGSHIEGLEELIALADGLPLHIAHINSYCRGQITGDPLLESSRALKALVRAPRARSESYLALINGTDARIENGVPKSNVTKTCLERGGHPATVAGMEAAIAAGWAKIHGVWDGETALLPPSEGLAHFRECESRVGVSFPVNSPAAAIALATAKTNSEFAIAALSTDGGAIPRNTTLKQGLALVRFGALSLEEFVRKACLNPARMLGLESKGHLGIGADADVIVVNPETAQAEWVVANGQVIMQAGEVVGRGGQLITTPAGCRTLNGLGVKSKSVEPAWLQ
jgi:cytosine/adenosine deaminase-related metal-dependent hydrolase